MDALSGTEQAEPQTDGDTETVAEVVPYIIPSHTIDNNDTFNISKAIRKWRPASRNRLLQASTRKILIELRESDAATPNLACTADMDVKSKGFDTIIAVHQLCLIHQLYLCVGLIIDLVGGPNTPLVSLLFCASKVLRTPGYWEKLLDTVPCAVKLCLVVKSTGWQTEYRTDTDVRMRTHSYANTFVPMCTCIMHNTCLHSHAYIRMCIHIDSVNAYYPLQLLPQCTICKCYLTNTQFIST